MRYKFLLLILSASGIALVALATSNYGVGLSPDSVVYVSVARNIADGNGFVLFNGTQFVSQPPLYPILLALLNTVQGFDPLKSIPVLNAIMYGGIIYMSGLMIERKVTYIHTMRVLGTLFILISIPLFQVAVMAWTEVLFILCITFFIAGAESYLHK